MNKQTLIISLIFLAGQAYSQSPSFQYKVVPVFPRQSLFLEGGANSLFGTGNSRNVIQINLPVNTVEWYYFATATDDKKPDQNYDLTAELNRNLDPGSGIIRNVNLPMTNSDLLPCDIFMLVFPSEARKFRVAQPFVGADLKDSRKSFLSGIVHVTDFTSGSCFLAIKNPSVTQGIHVNIEVVAIVKTPMETTNMAKQ